MILVGLVLTVCQTLVMIAGTQNHAIIPNLASPVTNPALVSKTTATSHINNFLVYLPASKVHRSANSGTTSATNILCRAQDGIKLWLATLDRHLRLTEVQVT